jgi:hypothetical protein
MIVTCMAVLVLTYPAAAVFRDYFHSVQTPGVCDGWQGATPVCSTWLTNKNMDLAMKFVVFYVIYDS